MTGFLISLVLLQTATLTLSEALWEAARAGDAARIAAVIDQGADVNAKAPYGMTALHFAADKGHLDAVRLLVARGADLNAQDNFYKTRPLALALANRHSAVGLAVPMATSVGLVCLKWATSFPTAALQAERA